MTLPVCIARGILLDSRAVASSVCGFGRPVVEQWEMLSLGVEPAGSGEICSSHAGGMITLSVTPWVLF